MSSPIVDKSLACSHVCSAGSLGIYLKVCLAITLLAILPSACFQIALVAMPPYGHFLKPCEWLRARVTCGHVAEGTCGASIIGSLVGEPISAVIDTELVISVFMIC